MSEKAAYEVVGIRPNGEKFTAEILGYQTLAEAVSLARYYAGLWESAVHLYRVPFLNTSSTPWAEDEIELVNKFTSERTERREPASYYEQWLDDLARSNNPTPSKT